VWHLLNSNVQQQQPGEQDGHVSQSQTQQQLQGEQYHSPAQHQQEQQRPQQSRASDAPDSSWQDRGSPGEVDGGMDEQSALSQAAANWSIPPEQNGSPPRSSSAEAGTPTLYSVPESDQGAGWSVPGGMRSVEPSKLSRGGSRKGGAVSQKLRASAMGAHALKPDMSLEDMQVRLAGGLHEVVEGSTASPAIYVALGVLLPRSKGCVAQCCKQSAKDGISACLLVSSNADC